MAETNGAGWRDRSVLVTGAGGFIGSHLVERLLHEGARVRALVRYTSSPGRGNLDDLERTDGLEVLRGDLRSPHGNLRLLTQMS